MSDGALAVAFFDPDRDLHGMARSGATLLFEGTRPHALEAGAALEGGPAGYTARADEELDLALEPVAAPVTLAGTDVRVCRVSGRASGRKVDCLGTVAETQEPPAFEELDAVRALSVLVDEGTALLAVARRPRGARGHGEELVTAALLREGEEVAVEEARISTVYDAEGRQRFAGLELWLPGEDFPRRGTGTVAAGSSLQLDGLVVHAAVFRWRLEERDGYGQYEIVTRVDAPAAA